MVTVNLSIDIDPACGLERTGFGRARLDNTSVSRSILRVKSGDEDACDASRAEYVLDVWSTYRKSLRIGVKVSTRMPSSSATTP